MQAETIAASLPANATRHDHVNEREIFASLPSIHHHRAVKPEREHSKGRQGRLGLADLAHLSIWQLGQYRHVQNLFAAMPHACQLQILVLVHPANNQYQNRTLIEVLQLPL